jgi:hypothetical protein
MIQKFRTYLYFNSSLYRKLGDLYFYFWYSIPFKIEFFKKNQGKKVVCYPIQPHPIGVLYKLFHLIGYKIISNPKELADLVVAYYHDATFRKKNKVLINLNEKQKVVNIYCDDVSKTRLDEIFRKVFGYSTVVDPKKHQGKYIKKSNLNSKHDGIILSSPEIPEKGYVYQKIINNTVKKNLVVDLRVPFIMGVIPLVYLKYRPLNNRFSNINSHVRLASVNQIFSKDEIKKIKNFSTLINLDYGEIDILRDKNDKRIYIVDVNPTPSGPPNHINKKDFNKALFLMSSVLDQEISKPKYKYKQK